MNTGRRPATTSIALLCAVTLASGCAQSHNTAALEDQIADRVYAQIVDEMYAELLPLYEDFGLVLPKEKPTTIREAFGPLVRPLKPLQ